MGDDLSRTVTRCALVAAAILAVAATFAAAYHASPGILGWLGAAFFFAAALAAGATARGLHASEHLREPREPHGPSHPAPLPPDVTRRDVFGRLWGLALGAFGILALVPFVALARRPPTSGSGWKAGSRLVTPDGKPLRPDDLAVGGVETVFPQGAADTPMAATLLIKLPENTGDPDPARRDWIQQGNIAYSKICTHAGCPVAIYREQSLQLYCPCHQSVFDVVRSGTPLSGPATRALPQLALDVDEQGYLVARGDYTDPIGPDDWWRSV
jgi:ubiquinol-cytochrome c reductase iron-sulfur subunit